MRRLERGEVVYYRIWRAWELDPLPHGHAPRFSPYHTGRVLKDHGEQVIVEVFGRGRPHSGTATWPKDRLRLGKPGIGPHWRAIERRRAIK